MRYPLIMLLMFNCFLATAQPDKLLSEAGKLLNEAQVLSNAGRYQASNVLLDEFIETYPTRMYDKGEVLFLKSYNHLQLGNLEAALADNTASLELRQQFIPEDAAKNYMRYGAIYLSQGQYEQALDQLFRSQDFPLIDDPQMAALIKGYTGNAYADLKQYEQARKYYQQSLDILLIEEGEESPDVSTNYYHIGRTFILEGKPGMAKEWFEKALMVEKNLEGGAVRKGQLYNAMGQVKEQAGRLPEAEEYYQQAVKTYVGSHGSSNIELIRSQINLAELKLKKEELESAGEILQEAIHQLCPGFAGNYPEDNPDVGELVLSRPLLARALGVKAALLLRSYEQQQPESLETALAAAQRAAAVLEEEVALLGGATSRLRLLEKHTEIYEIGITAAYKLYKNTGNLTYAEQAFELSERAKALLLRLNRISREGLQALPEPLREEEALRRHALKAAEVGYALHPNEPDQQQELAWQRQAYREFMGQLQSSAPQYYRQRFASTVATPQEIQAQLGEKQAMLSYFLGAEHYFIFALTGDNFRILRLSNNLVRTEAEIGNWGSLLNKNFNKGSGTGVYTKLDVKLKLPALPEAIKGYLLAIRKVDSQRFTFYSHSLYSQLLFPVKSVLDNKKELIIIPHGRLSYIPFEALISTQAGKPEKAKYQKYDYLIEDFAISYHHSASLYGLRPEVDQNYGEGLLGVAPVFDQKAGNSAVWSSSEFVFDTMYQQSASLRAAVPEGQRFVPLQFSETEMSGILEQFGKQSLPAVALLRAEATEEAFKGRAGQYRYLHLATHSFLDEANPGLSGIAFSQPESDAAEDGILYSSEIGALSLNAELVVLSSCESGIGPLSEGEGVLSLSRSFLDAGVPSVISSLWKVYDRYTAEMMVPFYKELLRGEKPAAALRQAKLKMIRKKATAAPRIWAGLILVARSS